MIQAVLFNIDKYKPLDARKWLKYNNYQPIKPVHKTKNYLRYRITEPNYKKFNYRFQEIKKDHIYFIIGYSKINI